MPGPLRQNFSRSLPRASLLLLLLAAGCGRFVARPSKEFVYVSAEKTSLRDRLAAVSNKIAEVKNGERLLVVEHGRRFLRVTTPRGEIGWIEEHAVIDQKLYDQFMALSAQHAHDPVIVGAILRDDSYLHIAPGRHTDHFFLLPENAKVQLIQRASIPKPLPPQGTPIPLAAKPKIVRSNKPAKGRTKSAEPDFDIPEGPPMQDWWLARDAQGHTGWVWSHMIDTDIPAEIAGLAEGQRYVGAYVLRTVDDPGSSFPNGQAPEYVALMNAWTEGLPYDFDQLRVFTWNTRKHRYETAYRERNIAGYLPVTISSGVFDNQTEPVFSFKVATGAPPVIDPATGAATPAGTKTEIYRLEGALVRSGEPPPPKPAAAARAAAPARASGTARSRARAERRSRPRSRRRRKEVH
jgi:SH3-like domain-containing protein